MLNVGTFSTFGEDSNPSTLLPRTYALGGYNSGSGGLLLEAFEKEKLDFLSLPETWNSDLRNILLSSFFGKYHVFIPSGTKQPGCKNACITNPYSAYSFTLGLNRWVQFCSFRNIPGTDFSCIKSTSELEFQGCILQFCPFLVPELEAQNNFQCINCMTNAIEGESYSERVLRCSSSYVESDAQNCKYAFGGESDIPVVTRKKPLSIEFIPFPENINFVSYMGFVYTKLKSHFPKPVHIFSTHLISALKNVPTSDDPLAVVSIGQIKYLINYINKKVPKNEVAVIVGDLNCGPGNETAGITPIWNSHYKLFLDAGFKSAFKKPVCTFGCNQFANSPTKQFLDNILIRAKNMCTSKEATFLDKEDIPISVNYNVSASDHFGIRASICMGH